MKVHEFIVVMMETSHPGNIGAAARAMKNMGMTQLRLVNCVNHRDTQAYNRSSGAEDILYQATCHKTLADAVQDCHHVIATSGRQRTNQHPPTLCARKLPDYLSRIQKQSIIALVFGNEQNGLDNQAIQQSHCQISVPTNPKFKSLNVASCVQLICFLCSAHGRQLTPNDSCEKNSDHQPTMNKIDALINTISSHAFEEAHGKAQHDIHKLRQLLFRLNPSEDETNFLHGMMRRLIKSGIDEEPKP